MNRKRYYDLRRRWRCLELQRSADDYGESGAYEKLQQLPDFIKTYNSRNNQYDLLYLWGMVKHRIAAIDEGKESYYTKNQILETLRCCIYQNTKGLTGKIGKAHPCYWNWKRHE